MGQYTLQGDKKTKRDLDSVPGNSNFTCKVFCSTAYRSFD